MLRYCCLMNPMQGKVEKLGKEGWQFVPGAPPVAVIHMARMKPQHAQSATGMGEMHIDDSKVFIVPKKH